MGILALLRIVVTLALTLTPRTEVRAEQISITCPAEIPRQSVQVKAPAGWTSFVPFEYTPGVPLSSAGVMYGPPAKMAISKPAGGGSTSVWRDIRPGPNGAWMACFYGDGGRQDMILSRRLDDRTRECAVTYIKRAKKPLQLDIRCR